MAITSGLFNSVKGDRKYDAKWFALYFATFIGNGVFPNPSTGLQVTENQNMRTVVKAGQGWINGYFIVNDSDYILQHDVADGVLKRIDRVVMRLNFATRAIEIVIKKGAYASSPVAPLLQRDSDAYELAIADVLINNGATLISQANITDLRLNKSLCGIVHGTVDQVDTTTLFNQYQSWFTNIKSTKESEFDSWMALEQQEFDEWFATIQGILDGNVAANLLSIITTHENDNERHVTATKQAYWDGKAPGTHTHTITQVTGLQTALDAKLAANLRNAANGFAGLDPSGRLLDSFMPLGSTKIADGEYTSDGTNNRFINVGFTPKLLIVTGWPTANFPSTTPAYVDILNTIGGGRVGLYNTSVGMFPYKQTGNTGIASNGFYVSGDGGANLNRTGYRYSWTAIG